MLLIGTSTRSHICNVWSSHPLPLWLKPYEAALEQTASGSQWERDALWERPHLTDRKEDKAVVVPKPGSHLAPSTQV